MREAMAAYRALPSVGVMRVRRLLLETAGVSTTGRVPADRFEAVRARAVAEIYAELSRNPNVLVYACEPDEIVRALVRYSKRS